MLPTLCVALVSCTPRHLVTPRIPAYLYQDWFLVLRLANLDAHLPAGASFTPPGCRERGCCKYQREPVAFLRTDN